MLRFEQILSNPRYLTFVQPALLPIIWLVNEFGWRISYCCNRFLYGQAETLCATAAREDWELRWVFDALGRLKEPDHTGCAMNEWDRFRQQHPHPHWFIDLTSFHHYPKLRHRFRLWLRVAARRCKKFAH